MTLRFSGRIFILLVVSLHSPCFLAKQQSNPPQQNASASKAAGGIRMLSDTEGVDFKSLIWLAVEPTDMRCGFDRLAERVRVVVGQSPLSGQLFVFGSRRGHRPKILVWDRRV